MRPFPRLLLVLCCLAVIAQCIALNRTTGAKYFTYFPDPALEAMLQADRGGFDPFHIPGVDEPAPAKRFDNTFHFGLLPAGTGKEALSAATIGGPAVLGVLVALAVRPRKR